jgi:peptidoglycan/xylan/chitin deacetylase (PgdA/CDA1 family)
MAFYIGLNVEHFELGKPSTTFQPVTAALSLDPLNHGWRDYGTRVGIWRMIDLLDTQELVASVLLNADVCSEYPAIVAEGRSRGWAWIAHGRNNSNLWVDLSQADERRELATITDEIERSAGTRPTGWLGPALTETPNTPRLLAEAGFTYLMDWCNDDEPYPLDVPGHRMVSVPYATELNDIPLFLNRGITAPEFCQMAIDQFDVLYAETAERPGAVMSLSLHPFIIGQPFRHKHLADALSYIRSHDDVWFTTSDAIAAHYHACYYDDHVAAREDTTRLT